MVLSCNQISKAFAEDVVLEAATFGVEEREKIAIVGLNGAGKTTLLKIIIGESAADSGEVVIARNKSLGYLAQHSREHLEAEIYQEVYHSRMDIIEMQNKLLHMEKEMAVCPIEEMGEFMEQYHRICDQFQLLEGYSYPSFVTGVLKGLGFSEEEFSKNIGQLSGGEKTRVFLAKLLVTKPDILLLDEPTNHLDIGSISWLEGFLSNYSGAIILVSHDRYFLDHIVTKVVEIENHKTIFFEGNYTEFAIKKQALRDAQLKHYLEQQKEIEHHEAVIEKLKSFNREASVRRGESREKLLAKIERVEKPSIMDEKMKFSLEPNVLSGNDVLQVKGLKKSYGNRCLFDHIDFEIKRGEKVAIIGDNGTGKTTILKILNQMIEADEGMISCGTNVHIGYYDQEYQVLNFDHNIFQEISDAYPNLSNTKIRNVLGAFLFSNEDVFKKIGDLSGGEKGRVALAKLMLSEANFLVLDEPTNHLDMNSKEILEAALQNYTGTILYVSHDRYFINKTATRILELEDQHLRSTIGNYDYYLEKKKQIKEDEQNDSGGKERKESLTEAEMDWKQQKELASLQRKKENEIKELETKIQEWEKTIEELEIQLIAPENSSNSGKLNELHTKYEHAKQTLDDLYEEWEINSLE
jgi:ATP-binding cassette, subfamily F, member 3